MDYQLDNVKKSMLPPFINRVIKPPLRTDVPRE